MAPPQPLSFLICGTRPRGGLDEPRACCSTLKSSRLRSPHHQFRGGTPRLWSRRRSAHRRDGQGAVVKGSGGDPASIQRDGSPRSIRSPRDSEVALPRSLRTKTRWRTSSPIARSTSNPRAASIDTPLHAFVPYAHVDHMHPDAVIAIAAAANSQTLTRQIFGDEIGWLPWQRRGSISASSSNAWRARTPISTAGVGGHGLFNLGHTLPATATPGRRSRHQPRAICSPPTA